MSLKLNTEELEKIMELFYTMSGIRIVVFDENYDEVIAYPKEKCSFCSAMVSVPHLAEKCRKSDLSAFEKCRKTDNIHICKCHAGLTEATIPLKENNKIIGYMMFGQITDLKDRTTLSDFVFGVNEKYDLNCKPGGIKYRSEKQINAAAKLLEICVDYILIEEMIAPDNNKITHLAKEYIKNHLTDDIKISDILDYVGCSRTKLYDVFKSDCNIGIAEYIKKKRLALSYNMLKSGEYTVSQVSEKAGFSDYNYFSRVFKKEYNVSPYFVLKNKESAR